VRSLSEHPTGSDDFGLQISAWSADHVELYPALPTRSRGHGPQFLKIDSRGQNSGESGGPIIHLGVSNNMCVEVPGVIAVNQIDCPRVSQLLRADNAIWRVSWSRSQLTSSSRPTSG